MEENPIFVLFFGVAMSYFPIFLTCPITGHPVCEIHKQRNEGFESLYMCIHKKGDPQRIQFICMYASPKITFEVLKKNIDENFKNIDVITTRCIIIGDFNMKSVLPNVNDYNEKLIEHMLKNITWNNMYIQAQQKMDLFWTCAFQIVQMFNV